MKSFRTISAALRAARRFRRDYGSHGAVYKARPSMFPAGYICIEVWQRSHGTAALYYSTTL